MNWTDKLVGYFSPSAGVQRATARRTFDAIANRTKRGFDAAKPSRRSSSWQPGGGSINTELNNGLRTIRNRSRDLIQNNGYMKRALKIMVSNIVGTGIMPKFANDRHAKIFKTWAEGECDAAGMLSFGAMQAQVVRAVWADGEVFVRYRIRKPEDGLTVPLQLQILEADHLDTEKTCEVAGGFCVAGVQFNYLGQRTGYWMFDNHPGDQGLFAIGKQSRFIPASEIEHIFDKTGRPGQVRGFSEFAVSVWKARDLDDYQEAHSVRKKIEACFAAFITTPDDGFRAGVTQAPDQQGRSVEELSPGLIQYLRQGEEIAFSSPVASDGYEESVRVELRVIAAGTGVTYEQLTGDYSQVNFTSGRMGKMEFKQMIEQFQWLTFIPGFCAQVAKRFALVAYLSGAYEKPNVTPENWTAPRIPMLDPLREAQAYQVLEEIGVMSRAEIIRELGYDPDAVTNEIEADSLRSDKTSETKAAQKQQRMKTLAE